MNHEQYFKHISDEVKKAYDVAELARAKGLDPISKVETPIAISLAEKAVGLISVIYPQLQDRRIINRILELEKQYGQLTMSVCLGIAEDITHEKYCKFESLLQAIDAGIRVAFSYFTLGVVSSPIEGYTELKLNKTKDGKDYFVAYFSGPIRSAGTTAGCVALMVIDYLREMFGFAKYDPTEDEVKRYVTENYDYHERVTNLQYLPSEEEITFLAKNIPFQISGEPTEQREVYNYKDLPRVETNFIRGGMCLTFSECLAQKAAKAFRLLKVAKENGFKSTGFDFIEEYINIQKKKTKASNDGDGVPTYMKDIVAGRPIYSHPSRSGGFRFRYGRARNSGFSAASVSPATMAISRNFLAVGTQLKIEKPTKGCAISMVENLEGPIVKLKDGSVAKPTTLEEGGKIKNLVQEIIYLGDILFSLDDVINRNYALLKPGYVEEWWGLQLKEAGQSVENVFNLGFEDAVKLSLKYAIPLHPKYIYYWTQIDYKQFLGLIDWIAHGHHGEHFVLPYNKSDRERFAVGKRALELIGCPHKVHFESVVLDKDDGRALLLNLGIKSFLNLEKDFDELVRKVPAEGDVLAVVNSLSGAVIKDKAGDFIGARMGRPEKAKLRKLTGSPHVIFPVGEEGGRLRSVQAAVEHGSVDADFPNYFCGLCGDDSPYPRCPICNNLCKKRNFCLTCKKYYDDLCEEHPERTIPYSQRRIDIKKHFELAKKLVGARIDELPVAVKGVRGTSSEEHNVEHLAKGLLRAKYNLHVNKDGTIRYDMTEMPISYFKPKEIGTSVSKLIELGYEKDYLGNNLVSDEQILEIFPHDIILPACPDTLDEKADDVFYDITKFVDDELEKLYGLDRFFNSVGKESLIGCLFACIAPHICTATVGRLIGFSKTQAFFASPFMHAAMRRDCIGYDNYVSVQENGEWRIEKIGDYIENLNPSEVIDGFGTKGKKLSGTHTWSNPGKKQVLEATKHSPRTLLRVHLQDGRKLDSTENHKIYLKGKIERKAEELKEGDQVMVSYKREIEERDIEQFYLPEIFKERDDVMIRNVLRFLFKFEKITKHGNFTFRDSFPIKFVSEFLRRHGKSLADLPDYCRISIKRDKVELPLRVHLTKEFLEVIGLYIAEGHARKNDSDKGFYQISVAGGEEVRGFVRKVFETHFGLKPSWETTEGITFSSRLLYELFVDYMKCGKGAKAKRIPSIFLNLKKSKIASLLRGYYEGDGSVSLSDARVCCDTVSEGLKQDLSFVLSRFNIFTKYYEYEKEPRPKVRAFYVRKGRAIPKFKITKITIPSNFIKIFKENIGFLSERKSNILNEICKSKPLGMRMDFDENYAYPKVTKIERLEEKINYCFNIAEEHKFFANDILVHNCDGDESAVILLMDMLLNFSRKFLPSHRGGTQDAPLVLNVKINAGEVDDQILDTVCGSYPLELYELAEQRKHSSEVKVEKVSTRLKAGQNTFTGLGFTHDCDDINRAVLNSAYKTLPTMHDKVAEQMDLCSKIRAVDTSDVARLIIERHFIRDIRGNLRKFSQQVFRCVDCNDKFRRPPLAGKCTSCGGKIIFTISEGSIIKYMEAALNLARTFNVSPYLLENLEIVQNDIWSIFGRDKEKQMKLSF